MKEIRMYKPDIGFKEIFNVSKTMFNGWLGYGESVNNFKEKITNKLKLDKKKCVITGSATDALFILFKTLNLKGDVILPSIAYSGIANAIKESGSNPIFCDVEKDLNISFFNMKKIYQKNCKAVIINNYAGYQQIDLYKIKNFCKEKNMLLIEDRACNLLGGKANHLADIVIYSFNNMKIITTIEGGMIYINNNKYIKIIEKLNLYTYLGNNKNILTNNYNYFQNQDITVPGGKSIMSSVGAEIGLCQIDKLDGFVEKRLQFEQIYKKELQDIFYLPLDNNFPKNWYWIRTDKDKKIKIIDKLIENKINTNFKYYPLHMTSLYKKNDLILQKSEELKDQIVCLPLHTCLKEKDIKMISNILKSVK
jgi:dTDP-4-amino-4,6-dideoxygalactose transaminase